MSGEARLVAWLDDAFFRVMILEDHGLHDDDGVNLDYSGGSLRGLAKFVHGYYNTPDDIRFDELDPGVEVVSVDAIAAYLGDTLIRVADGFWEWSGDADLERFPDGVPVVRPNGVLGLDPVSPFHLMMDVVRSRDEESFTALYQEWTREVERVRETQPLWPASDSLIGWLTRCRDSFPDWVAAYAPDGVWDFSPDSLPALEELVRRVVPVKVDLKLPVNREFRDGAAWYLGEVLRRGIGGRWSQYDPPQTDDDHAYIEGIGPRNITSTPVVALRIAINRPGYLRAHYDNAAG